MQLAKRSARRGGSPFRRFGCFLRMLVFLLAVIFTTCLMVFTIPDTISLFVFSHLKLKVNRDMNLSSLAFLRPPPPPIKPPAWIAARINTILLEKAPPPILDWWPTSVKGNPHRAGGAEGLDALGHKARVNEIGFVLFEPWNGGWNNRRMSLELAISIAAISNRTLVLPPVMWVNMMKGESGYESFFHLPHMRRWVNVLTWVEFEALFRDTILPALPPSAVAARTVDCGHPGRRQAFALCEKFTPVRKTAITRVETLDFTTNNYMHPCSISKQYGGCAAPDRRLLHEAVAAAAADETLPSSSVAVFVTNSSDAVMRSFMLKRKANAIPGPWFWPDGSTPHPTSKPHLLHFAQTLFMPWYTVLWQPSRAAYDELVINMRDHVHFREDLVQIAWRVVRVLGTRNFTAVHARRQDFKLQYKTEFLEPETVSSNIAPLVEANETIYLASDEGDVDYYSRFSRLFPDRVVRLKNFAPLLEGVKEWQLPMVEQLICAYARVFIGTRLSTFSAYITRIRGYLTTKHKWPKPAQNVYFTDQRYPPDIVIPEDQPFSFSGVLWAREYPEAWAMPVTPEGM